MEQRERGEAAAVKWWTLGVVSVATFMLLLDITVVNVALPSIRNDLDGSFADVQWVIDAYALSLAAFVLTAGSLADRFGRRLVFCYGLALFSGASVICAVAPDPTLLNVARTIQGIGGAAMFAVSLALIAQEFAPGRQRATAMGVYGASIGAAAAIGPLVGGMLTEQVSWRSIFYLNVPVGLAALRVTHRRVRESRDPAGRGTDWAGAATFSAALFLLVLALVRGNADGWGSPFIVSLVGGVVLLLVAFIAIERTVDEPMLPLPLFAVRTFTGVQLTAFTVAGALYAMFLYIGLYVQNYLGYSPIQTGLRYLPVTITSLLASLVAGAFMSRLPARALMCGSLVVTGGGLLLMSGVRAGDGWDTLLPGMVVVGVGTGLLAPVVADVALSVVPNDRSGMAAGINDTFRQVGVAVGTAVWGAVLLARGADKAGEMLASGQPRHGDLPRTLVEAASSGEIHRWVAAMPAPVRDAAVRAGSEGMLAGFNTVLTLAAIVCFAGAALAVWLVREHEIDRAHGTDAPETLAGHRESVDEAA